MTPSPSSAPQVDGGLAESQNTDQATRWRDLVNAVGEEISTPLTQALERVHALTTSGRIDRSSLRALREEVETARAVGIVAQQITRLASGRLRQSHERLDVAELLGNVLTHRAREAQARGIVIKSRLQALPVIVDASLLFGLLNTLLDWALRHSKSEVNFTVEMLARERSGRLTCRFTPFAAEQLNDGAAVDVSRAKLNSLTWRLLEQTAWTMGLPLSRLEEGGIATLAVDFPRTAHEAMEGVTSIELDEGFAVSSNSKPLAGSHVLIVASRREVRMQLRESIKDMGLIIDMVASVEEAADFCHEGLPHAIVVEGILRGEALKKLRLEIIKEVPDFAFVEIVEEGNQFEMSGTGNRSVARVGRGAIESALPSVLMFELSKSL
ncbi:MAG: hypothetical protein ACKOF9_10755 [Burkholderiales bacterium]